MPTSQPLAESSPSEQLRYAHQRFARTALGIYLLAAGVAVTLLFVFATTERSHEIELQTSRLLQETQLRAHQLARQLGLVVGELRRLGLRSEVDLLNQNLEPDKSLLRLSHVKSTFFNVGVAVIDADGHLVWSEPQGFVPEASLANENWFRTLRQRRAVGIVPVEPERVDDSLIYVVSPVIRNDAFSGCLVGAIDLARAGPIDFAIESSHSVRLILATFDSRVVYPPTPPRFAAEPSWRALFYRGAWEPQILTAQLEGETQIAAAAPVAGADLVLLTLVPQNLLGAAAQKRMLTRLGLGLSLALFPFVVLVLSLKRTFRTFRAAEQAAMREERLRLVGEAANLIAHEVKNGLNGLRMGLDVIIEGRGPSSERVLESLRSEMSRLADFASELMLFSKGVTPRPARIDLCELVSKVVTLARDTAADSGVAIDLELVPAPIELEADPALVHVIISNLLSNAVDAVSAEATHATPRVTVRTGTEGRDAVVRVRDAGPGVEPEVRPRLFEPFVTGKPNGVGIGLALSRQIARAHGGDLVLEETPAGACFALTLPRGPS
jgi:signal transduction histidine kinase